jgi:predicted deacetylase
MIISLNDFTPKYHDQMLEIVEELQKRDISPLSILIVPNQDEKYDIRNDPALQNILTRLKDSGCEVVLHGYNHTSTAGNYRTFTSLIKGIIYGINEVEFESLNYEESKQKIIQAKKMFEDNIKGFVAPGWSLNEQSLKAIIDSGFLYTTTRNKIINLKNGKNINARVLEFSGKPQWADYASRAINYFLLNFQLKNAPLIRIPIHPHDLKGSRPFNQAINIIENLKDSRKMITYNQYVEMMMK